MTGWAGAWACRHRCARFRGHRGNGPGPALPRGSPGSAHPARLAARSDPCVRRCSDQRRDRAAAVPAGDPLLGEPEHELSRAPQEPTRHHFVRHRSGDRHRGSGVMDGASARHGITRGGGPRCRALPHRRCRGGRPGEKAATPGPHRAARREHHQRRDRAGPVRRDRPRRDWWGRGQPARFDGPVYRLLPRWYRRGGDSRGCGDFSAQGNRRATRGRSAEPAHAVRGVLAGPIPARQRRGRGHGVRSHARLLRAGGDPGPFPAAVLWILGYFDIPDQRLVVGVCRSPDPERGARHLPRRRWPSPRCLPGPSRHRRHHRDADCCG